MENNKIWLLDTTLRDGMQGEGISYTVSDKLEICKTLDELGIAFIEAGFPSSTPKDDAFFKEARALRLKNAKICAFGTTRRKNSTVDEDAGISALCGADTEWVTIVGKASLSHVTHVLETSPDENILMISDTVAYMRAHEKNVIFDAEHFFDGYLENREYAMKTLETALSAGATFLVLCDTNGGILPENTAKIIRDVTDRFGDKIGVHMHNDGGLADANSIAAVNAGARHIQGTFLGFGERCGNAALTTLIPNLQLAMGMSCIDADAMKNLTDSANRIAELSNVSLNARAPFVGRSAFAHKAGMHTAAMLKQDTAFEPITPQSVGNTRRFLLSEMAGRSALMSVINRAVGGEVNSSMTDAVLRRLKELESEGYQFEAAEASFELITRKVLGLFKPSFELIGFKTIGEQADGKMRMASAIVHISVDGKPEMTAAVGNGPVNALDRALRKALELFYPNLREIHLIDYKVRVLDHNSATAARTRVLITSTDGVRTWCTVGVSQDIIQASWIALVDSIEYKLMLG